MRFLLLIHIDQGLLATLSADEYDRQMCACLEHADALRAQGVLLDSQQLEAPATARTLRVRDARTMVSDGPFAETKEMLAGFNLIEAADHADAMRIAESFPWGRYGCIEVRAVRDLDQIRAAVGAGAGPRT